MPDEGGGTVRLRNPDIQLFSWPPQITIWTVPESSSTTRWIHPRSGRSSSSKWRGFSPPACFTSTCHSGSSRWRRWPQPLSLTDQYFKQMPDTRSSETTTPTKKVVGWLAGCLKNFFCSGNLPWGWANAQLFPEQEIASSRKLLNFPSWDKQCLVLGNFSPQKLHYSSL